MPPFKCRGKGKIGQKAPLVNHYKIHTCTQPIRAKKWNKSNNKYSKVQNKCAWDI